MEERGEEREGERRRGEDEKGDVTMALDGHLAN